MSKTAKAGAAQLLALLNAGTFDAETSKVLKAALEGKPADDGKLHIKACEPKPARNGGNLPPLVEFRKSGAKTKQLSPRLVRAIVEHCETPEGRAEIVAACDKCDSMG